MEQAAYYDTSADWSLIPPHMRGAVERYVMHGIPGGSFLTALMAGASLTTLLALADDQNQAALRGWGQFIYWHVPGGCHGSTETVRAWIERGGVVGRDQPQPDATDEQRGLEQEVAF